MKLYDPYEILQVSRNSTPQEIIKSVRKLQYKYHPDRPTGNRELYDCVMEAYDTIKNNPQSYINLNEFIKSYKNSEEEHRDIIEAYKKYKGNIRKIMDSLILLEECEEMKVRDKINEEIKNGTIKKYKLFDRKLRKRKDESKKAIEIAEKLGIDLNLPLEDLLNRQNNRHTEMILSLEKKYGNKKSITKKKTD